MSTMEEIWPGFDPREARFNPKKAPPGFLTAEQWERIWEGIDEAVLIDSGADCD